MQLFWPIYFVLMNLAALYLMYSDKQKAIKKEWRVPEITLLSFCLLGGAIGVYLGMKYFRHKNPTLVFPRRCCAFYFCLADWLALLLFSFIIILIYHYFF